jgi:signal peptidase I
MVVARRASCSPQVRARNALDRFTAGSLRFVVRASILLALLAVFTPVVLVVLGYQPTIVHTDRMEPAVAEWDIVVNEYVTPAEIEPGDIVTFSDEFRNGAVFTERVVETQPFGDVYVFTTKRDVSDRLHQWTTPQADEVARIAYTVPGHPLSVASTLTMQGMVPLGALVCLLVAAAVRRV